MKTFFFQGSTITTFYSLRFPGKRYHTVHAYKSVCIIHTEIRVHSISNYADIFCPINASYFHLGKCVIYRSNKLLHAEKIHQNCSFIRWHLSANLPMQVIYYSLWHMYFVRCFDNMQHRYTCIEMQHEYVYMQKYENTNVQSDSKIT